jgi:(1->4)-alpha-D-glucan 1-alpha-D-glucosylmutase
MSDLGKSLPKLYLIKKILKLRQNYPAFNEPDSYKPIDVFGSSSENLVAFMRGNNIIVLVPRLLVGLNKGWGVTRIIFPDGDWQNVFTDEIVDSKTVKIKDILRDFPVAVFKRKLEKEE